MSVNYGGRTAEQHGLLNISDDLVGYLFGFLEASRLLMLSICAKNHKTWIPISSIKTIRLPSHRAVTADSTKILFARYFERFPFTGIMYVHPFIMFQMRFCIEECETIASLLLLHLAADCRVSLAILTDVVHRMSTSLRFKYPQLLKLMGMATDVSVCDRSIFQDRFVPEKDNQEYITFSEMFPNACLSECSVEMYCCREDMYGPLDERCGCAQWATFTLSCIHLGVGVGCCDFFVRNGDIVAEQFQRKISIDAKYLLQAQTKGYTIRNLATAECVRKLLEQMSADQLLDFFTRSSVCLRSSTKLDEIVAANLLKYSPDSVDGQQWMQVAERILTADMRGEPNWCFPVNILVTMPDVWLRRYLSTALAMLREAAEYARRVEWTTYELFKENLRFIRNVFGYARHVQVRSKKFVPEFPFGWSFESMLLLALKRYGDNGEYETVDSIE